MKSHSNTFDIENKAVSWHRDDLGIILVVVVFKECGVRVRVVGGRASLRLATIKHTQPQ